jgi:hypothetical protein
LPLDNDNSSNDELSDVTNTVPVEESAEVQALRGVDDASLPTRARLQVCVCVCICVYVCMYGVDDASLPTRARLQVCVCVFVCIYVCMYVCM